MIKQVSRLPRGVRKQQNNAFSFLVTYQRMQKEGSCALYGILCLMLTAEDL